MSIDELIPLLSNPTILIGALAVSVLVLVWVARRVRKVARSERPDDALSNVAMLIGLGWSSEAVWELTGRIPDFPVQLRYLVFFVLEVLLTLAMIRAKRHVRLHGWPGRAGTTAWMVAGSMALVAAAVSHSLAEAALRFAIPLLITKQWWDGLVGDGAQKPQDATSWRWTPRRLGLWLGAIEPGERDVESVNRERLTQQMTQLEFRRRHGSKRLTTRRAARLARSSLAADDSMIAEVRRRVDRSMWFEVAHSDTVPAAVPPAKAPIFLAPISAPPMPEEAPTSGAPGGDDLAGQKVRQDTRSAQQIEDAVRAMHRAAPKLSQRKIAESVVVPATTVRRILQAARQEEMAHSMNGREPEFAGAVVASGSEKEK